MHVLNKSEKNNVFIQFWLYEENIFIKGHPLYMQPDFSGFSPLTIYVYVYIQGVQNY